MNVAFHNLARTALAAIVVVALIATTGCGGGSTPPSPTPPPPPPPPPPPTAYRIGGSVAGLDAGQSVVLQDNGGDNLTVSANGVFAFATKVSRGGTYTVTVSSPTGKTCTVSGGSGTASAEVTSVAVVCFGPLTIGGTVSGLVGQGLALQLSAAPSFCHHPSKTVLAIAANGDFVFPTAVGCGAFIVSVIQQPHSPAQPCIVGNAQFEIAGARTVSDIRVVCGEFSYVTNATDNTVSAFSIDASTGALVSSGASVSAGQSPKSIVGTSDKKYLYVGNELSNNVSAFSIEASSGALASVPGSPFATGANPRALALYSVTTYTDAHTYLYSYNSHLNTYLYVTDAGSDDLSVYELDQGTGALTPSSPASYATGAAPSAIVLDRGYLYTANTGGLGDISAFLIDPNTGGLTPVAGAPFASGSNVNSLAGGAEGAFIYAANANGGAAAISGFGVDPNSGALTPLPGFPYALPSGNYIASDRDGVYLYATAGTNLFGYRIDPLTGALSLLSGFPVAVGANADSMSIDPTNQFLYVRNGSAGTVTGFELDAATGALALMPGSPFAVGTSADFIATF